MTLGQKIKAARNAQNLPPLVVANELGVSVQALYQWESDTTKPSAENLIRLSNLLDFDIREKTLLGTGGAFRAAPGYMIPVIPFSVSSSQWSPLEALVLESSAGRSVRMLVIDWKPSGEAYALRLDDDSMAPHYQANDTLIFDTGREATPGDVVLVRQEGSRRALIRRYRPRNFAPDGRILVEFSPFNDDYPIVTTMVPSAAQVAGTLFELRRSGSGPQARL